MSHENELGHVVENKIFLRILAALLCLTVVTVLVSPSVGFKAFDFGSFNIVIALFIASIKATLVILWFMHLKYENKVTIMYVIFPVSLLFCMLAGIFIDNPFRDALLKPAAIEPGKVITQENYGNDTQAVVSPKAHEAAHEEAHH